MSTRQQFEQELKNKLDQKGSVHQGAEAVLMKSFKYFDLDNSGTVDLQEFIKAIEKIGIVIQSLEEIETLFKQYDTSGDGVLDYQEFASIVFGNQSASTRKFSPQKTVSSQEQLMVERSLENFRQKLASRGARGMIGLQRSFKIMDDDDSKSLDIYEFTKAVKDYRIDVPETEIQILFNAFDVNRDGTLSYDEFLRAVRGPMNAFRKSLVSQAFNKLDKDGSGVIDLNDIRGVYNAKNHPDVKQGKKTEEEILLEFLETFEMHHNIAGGTAGDHVVDKEEWEEYYNNVSASIDNDEYFQLMMTNAWKLNEGPPPKKGELVTSSSMKGAFGGKSQAQKGQIAGVKAAPEPNSQPQTGGNSIEALFEKFRSRLAARGSRGMIGLQRSFKIMDDNHSLTLDKQEFVKAIKDFRIDISENDLGRLFDAFDRDGSGELSYDEFLRSVRGPMNQNRKVLVHKAFKKLDKDGSGQIDINDIKGVYDAKNHPDVKSGKKTEDDILGDFLETFEMHHNVSNKARSDQIITLAEFEEYYNNISMSIDDDAYFELMMTNTWKLSGQSEAKKAWAGQVGGKEPLQGRAAWAADHHKPPPFGTSPDPIDYSTQSRPTTASQAGGKQGTSQAAKGTTEELVERFRAKLLSRGARGIIGLQRQFKIMDDNNNNTLDLPEFAKAIKDFRVEIPENDIARVFKAFDRDGSGTVDYDELLRQIRGPMNQSRINLCKRAFQKIDKSGDGVLEISDLKGVYNAKSHPDVKSGKKTEDDILCEFLDTFEMHHSLAVRFYIQTGGTGRDSHVTLEEWLEYYNNVSCSIDDDRYFELMMNNAWNLDNKAPAQKAWTGEVGSQPATKKKYF